MLLSYYINLVKLEMLWLSKILGMTYNLEWREYFIMKKKHTTRIFSFFGWKNVCTQRVQNQISKWHDGGLRALEKHMGSGWEHWRTENMHISGFYFRHELQPDFLQILVLGFLLCLPLDWTRVRDRAWGSAELTFLTSSVMVMAKT